jgi:hypothetical protein
MIKEYDDIGLISEPIPALVQVLRDKIALSVNEDYRRITVSPENGRITQEDVEEKGANIPQIYVSLVSFSDINTSCITSYTLDLTIELMIFGGNCGGFDKHQWAKIMMTLATKIIVEHGSEAGIKVDRSTLSGLSLDTTTSRLAGLGVWQITFQAESSLDTTEI